MSLFDKVLKHIYYSPFCTIDLVQDENHGILSLLLSTKDNEVRAMSLPELVEKSGLSEEEKAIVRKELNLANSISHQGVANR